MEYSSLSRQRTSLQRAVDGAALAAARELSLVNADETRVATVGRGVIVSSLAHGSTVPASVSVAVINNRSAVEVQASQAVGSIMGKLLSLPEAELRAAATATLRGSTRLCMLGLDPSLAGTVRLYFRGQSAILDLGVDSTISLSAPKDGALAGILFFEDPGSPPMRRFSVSSDNARKPLGSIYLPKASFYVDANKPVADLSTYTVVVARQIELSAGPNLVLNANYGSTDVPVPKGVGPIGADVNLSQ